MNKERLVFEVPDGVTTPEEGSELVSKIFDDKIFFEVLDFFLILESCSGGPILAFIGCKTEG